MSERERAHEKKGNKPVGKWNKKRRPKKRRKLNHSLVSYTHTKLKSKRKPIFICTNSRFPCTLHTTLTYIDTHASKHTDQHIAYTHTQHSNWIQAHGSEKNNASFFISSLFSYVFFFFSSSSSLCPSPFCSLSSSRPNENAFCVYPNINTQFAA